MIYLLFLLFPALVATILLLYFLNWKDERPDLGGFGGRK